MTPLHLPPCLPAAPSPDSGSPASPAPSGSTGEALAFKTLLLEQVAGPFEGSGPEAATRPHVGGHHRARPHAPAAHPLPTAQAAAAPGAPPSAATASPADSFLGRLAGVAKSTAGVLGLSPHLLLAQAALESGWGRRSIRGPQGQESYNLFGLKAGAHWKGRTVEVATVEYVEGRARTKVESFRAYASYAEAFADYAHVMRQRYGEALAPGATAESFGKALQAKGYATDPAYALKIARVARSVARRLGPEGPASGTLVG